MQHLGQQILSFNRDTVPLGLIEIQVPIQYVILGLLLIVRYKWHPPCQHCVQHNTKRPDIGLSCMRFLCDDLWGAIR